MTTFSVAPSRSTVTRAWLMLLTASCSPLTSTVSVSKLISPTIYPSAGEPVVVPRTMMDLLYSSTISTVTR